MVLEKNLSCCKWRFSPVPVANVIKIRRVERKLLEVILRDKYLWKPSPESRIITETGSSVLAEEASKPCRYTA